MKLERIVTESCIAETFGEEAYMRYLAYRAIQRSRHHSFIDLAERFEIPKLTVWGWMKSFDDPRYPKPKSVRCINSLYGLGYLPLSYNSKNFRDLNLLAAWAFWSGTISRGYMKRLTISVDKDNSSEVKGIIRRLGLKYSPESNREALKVTDHSSAVGRLLYCMGLPERKKSTNGVDVPRYIMNCPYRARIKDFVDVLFRARCVNSGNRRPRIYLFATKQEKSAEHLAKSVRALVKKAGYERPNIKVVHNGYKRNYQPLFTI